MVVGKMASHMKDRARTFLLHPSLNTELAAGKDVSQIFCVIRKGVEPILPNSAESATTTATLNRQNHCWECDDFPENVQDTKWTSLAAQSEWSRWGHAPQKGTSIPKIFAATSYKLSTVRKLMEGTVWFKTTSVTDDVIDWPLQNKILDCATETDERAKITK